jgi:hypothetical protein
MSSRRSLCLAGSLLALIAFVTTTIAGGGVDTLVNDVTILSTSPFPGTVSVSGTYTVADGYSMPTIVVTVAPAGGVAGQGGYNTAQAGSGNFNSTVSAPAGTYDVQAIMTVVDGEGTPSAFYSDVTTVTIP